MGKYRPVFSGGTSVETSTLMAKKKSASKRVKRESITAFRSNAEFKAWLDEFADHERLAPTQLLELGLVEMAKLKGFRLPPRR